MSVFRQGLIVFFLLQILFGYFEYRYRADLFYILEQLVKPKYLVTSLVITIAYVFLAVVLTFLFSP